MPMDAVCLGAVIAEVRAAALGARIDKIQQPARIRWFCCCPGGCAFYSTPVRISRGCS